MSGDDEIVRLAALTRKTDLSAEDERELDRGLATLNAADMALVNFAAKLLEGKPYAVLTDNPETVRRHREIAQHVGAPVQVIEQGGGLTRIHFSPPSRPSG